MLDRWSRDCLLVARRMRHGFATAAAADAKGHARAGVAATAIGFAPETGGTAKTSE
jgi:hypothetical protein